MPNAQSIAGKAALVTGGARRVGRRIALALAEAGMHVAITYNDSHAQAREVVAEIESHGRRALAIQCDQSRPDAVNRIVDALTRHFDRLDALVNNASTFEPTPFGSITAERYDYDMAVNARSPLLLIQALAGRLAAGYVPGDPASTGRIVNLIDIHVLGEPLKEYLSYNASKAALMEITASCAIELAPAVTVNALAPGVVEWAESYGPEIKAAYMKRVPLGRPGTPDDAAAAVLFLIRDAHYCTGQILRLDGGRALT
jgi:pteridine reductase